VRKRSARETSGSEQRPLLAHGNQRRYKVEQRISEEHNMDRKCLAVGTCAALALAVLMTPVMARPVTQAQRDACWRAAEYVRPALNWREKEAWIAGCLADATVGSPPKKSRNY
jgi:hypothetical protein